MLTVAVADAPCLMRAGRKVKAWSVIGFGLSKTSTAFSFNATTASRAARFMTAAAARGMAFRPMAFMSRAKAA
ncbi:MULTISPECIES: hypothetical protein [Aurantimonadaceae]|jgi:hypothetical protein|uniref:hypothetical protein n=2 Tax=Hyphomicrobiales TaxID=356 RepID=UPI000ACB2D8C|nr:MULTISPECIES: hypothetical protein [Aurantimonadaceae]MCQ0989855.1 hypothetical protein [Jiella sp. LLJ827]